MSGAAQKQPGLSRANAEAAWGIGLPDWVGELADYCDAHSQTKAGQRISYSGSAVNSVLKRRYNGDYASVEKAVRGALMQATVECPILGEIGSDACLLHQRKALTFQPTSSMRVQLYKTCRSGGCPHSRMGGARG